MKEPLGESADNEVQLPHFIRYSKRPDEAAKAYEAAYRYPEQMAGVKSYCGYGENLLECFIKGRVGKRTSWNEHGAHCGSCIDAALDVARLVEQGSSMEVVESVVREKYELPRPQLSRMMEKHPLGYVGGLTLLLGLYAAGRPLAHLESGVSSRIRAMPGLLALAVGPALLEMAGDNFLEHLGAGFRDDDMWIPMLTTPLAAILYPAALLFGDKGRRWRAALNVGLVALGVLGFWFHNRRRIKMIPGGVYAKKLAGPPPIQAPLVYAAMGLLGMLGTKKKAL